MANEYPQQVQLKVECHYIGRAKGWGKNRTIGTIKLSAVTDSTGGDKAENSAFFAATPSGSMEFGTVNDGAMAMFYPGGTYIVTISPAPDSPIAEFTDPADVA